MEICYWEHEDEQGHVSSTSGSIGFNLLDFDLPRRLLYRFRADSHEEAMREIYRRQGWGEYKPQD